MITKLNSGLVIEEEFMKFGLSFFNIVIEIKTSKLIGQNIKVGVVGIYLWILILILGGIETG